MKNTTQNIDPNKVAQKAYEYYLQRGCQQGNELEDWLRAEAELNAPLPSTKSMAPKTAAATKTKKKK
ncbi:DUF2934 domain-containing protein [Bdellovibrionota bacterium FG-2]